MLKRSIRVPVPVGARSQRAGHGQALRCTLAGIVVRDWLHPSDRWRCSFTITSTRSYRCCCSRPLPVHNRSWLSQDQRRSVIPVPAGVLSEASEYQYQSAPVTQTATVTVRLFGVPWQVLLSVTVTTCGIGGWYLHDHLLHDRIGDVAVTLCPHIIGRAYRRINHDRCARACTCGQRCIRVPVPVCSRYPDCRPEQSGSWTYPRRYRHSLLLIPVGSVEGALTRSPDTARIGRIAVTFCPYIIVCALLQDQPTIGVPVPARCASMLHRSTSPSWLPYPDCRPARSGSWAYPRRYCYPLHLYRSDRWTAPSRSPRH